MNQGHSHPGNGSQLRLLQVIEALSGHEVNGIRLTDVARAIGAAQPTALRDLQTLAAGHWAEQLPDGKWRLSAKPMQILTNFSHGLQSAQRAVADVTQRYTRSA